MVLYLASQSQSRKKLLTLAQIPFVVIEHKSDECGIEITEDFEKYVMAIAKHKMEQVVIPKEIKEKIIFVLSADTLIRTAKTKVMLGKPENKKDAERMISLLRNEPAELITACCLDKKENFNGSWKTIVEKHWTTPATLTFSIEPEMVDKYFEEEPGALKACGAGVVEGFGLNFLKSMTGSFTSVLGLPLFELRQALKELGFN